MARIIILFVAVVSGLAATWLVAGGKSGVEIPAAQAAVPQAELKEVLVAASEIKAGGELDEANVRWQQWPGDAAPENAIARSERAEAITELKGHVARSGFVTGEPIRDDKLAQPGTGYLSVLLPAGKRAVAVRITAENTAGGFILPNDRVDVVHTVARQSEDGTPQSSSRTILTNIRVLAVDQTANEADAGSAVVGKTATLEVDPPHVEILAAAETTGTLSLALRSSADNDEKQEVNDGRDRSRGIVRIISAGQVRTVEISKN